MILGLTKYYRIRANKNNFIGGNDRMLGILFYPEEDEHLYGFISRYYDYSVNTSAFQTKIDLFGRSNCVIPIHFQNHLSELAEILSQELEFDLTTNWIIENLTITDFIKPFLTIDQYQNAVSQQVTLHWNIKKSFFKANSILHPKELFRKEKDMIKVCPVCYTDEMKRKGYAILHRSHNVPGIKTCYKHGCYLDLVPLPSPRLIYSINNDYQVSNIRYPALSVSDEYVKLNANVMKIFEGELYDYSRKEILKKFKSALSFIGITSRYDAAYHDLKVMFYQCYSEAFLLDMEVPPINAKGSTWMDNMFFANSGKHHYTRYLIVIMFLFGGIDEMVKYGETKVILFKNAKVDLLNSEYQKDIAMWIINNQNPESFHQIELTSYIPSRLMKLFDMYKHFPRKKMNKQYFTKTDYTKSSFEVVEDCKNKLLIYMKNHPDCTRKEIRAEFDKEWRIVLSCDRQWWDDNAPKKIVTRTPEYWKHKDIRTLEAVVKMKRSSLENGDQITRFMHAQELSCLLLNNMDKLPKTMEILQKDNQIIDEKSFEKLGIKKGDVTSEK